MGNLRILKENEDGIIFQFDIEKHANFGLRVKIVNREDGWKWHLSAGITHWNSIGFYNKRFFLKFNIEGLSTEIEQEINRLFYEFFRELKKHPAYRLKLIHMLNDEIREIWEIA